jgi:hypothetical protein
VEVRNHKTLTREDGFHINDMNLMNSFITMQNKKVKRLIIYNSSCGIKENSISSFEIV